MLNELLIEEIIKEERISPVYQYRLPLYRRNFRIRIAQPVRSSEKRIRHGFHPGYFSDRLSERPAVGSGAALP